MKYFSPKMRVLQLWLWLRISCNIQRATSDASCVQQQLRQSMRCRCVLLFFAINDSNLSNYAFSAGTSENLVEWHEKNLIDIWFAFLDDQLVKYKLFSLTHHTQSDLFICFLIEINEPLDEAHKSSQPLLTPFPRCTHCQFTFQIIEIT